MAAPHARHGNPFGVKQMARRFRKNTVRASKMHAAGMLKGLPENSSAEFPAAPPGDGDESTDEPVSLPGETPTRQKSELVFPGAAAARDTLIQANSNESLGLSASDDSVAKQPIPRVHRETDAAVADMLAQFRLPSINSDNSSGSVVSSPSIQSLLASELSEEAEELSQVSSDVSLSWERKSVLGKAYSKKAHRWHTDKQTWRRDTPRPDIAKTEMEGLLVCVPYNTLRLGLIEEPPTMRAPSAVTKSRQRLERLTQGSSEAGKSVNPSRKIKGLGKDKRRRSTMRITGALDAMRGGTETPVGAASGVKLPKIGSAASGVSSSMPPKARKVSIL